MLPFVLPPSPGYVVALSGGADSRLLLELTVRAVLACAPADEVGKYVRAAHLHHGIRGDEADRDADFCRRVCAELGVPLTVEHADIPALARESDKSEETAAREARYAFFVRVMKETGFPVLLTAHNADDQLETVLHHLLRGSGTRGMAGIPAERPLGDALPDGTPLTVRRPLLDWSRRDIVSALDALGLPFVTDSTNASDTYTRNRLRHHVTPLLEDIFGAGIPQAAAVRLGRAAREDEDALSAIAAAQYRAAASEYPSAAGLPLCRLAPEPAIAKRMISLAYADHVTACPSSPIPADRTLSAYNLDDILALCRAGQNGTVSQPLPNHVRAEIHDGTLTFASSAPDVPVNTPPRLLGKGVTVWDELLTVQIDTADTPLSPLSGQDVFASAVFPADNLSLPLLARVRMAGDVILSHGMTKSLKKLMCDKHIFRKLRDRLPLFCLHDGTPLWCPAVAFRDGYMPPEDGPSVRVTVYLHSH